MENMERKCNLDQIQLSNSLRNVKKWGGFTFLLACNWGTTLSAWEKKREKERQIWANERYGGVNSAKIWDWGAGGVVEQLNCWAWVSDLAWTPGSACCLVEAAGEMFGLESKTGLLAGWALQPAPISLESPFSAGGNWEGSYSPTSLNKWSRMSSHEEWGMSQLSICDTLVALCSLSLRQLLLVSGLAITNRSNLVLCTLSSWNTETVCVCVCGVQSSVMFGISSQRSWLQDFLRFLLKP